MILPNFMGILISQYMDPYKPTRIQWKVSEVFFFVAQFNMGYISLIRSNLHSLSRNGTSLGTEIEPEPRCYKDTDTREAAVWGPPNMPLKQTHKKNTPGTCNSYNVVHHPGFPWDHREKRQILNGTFIDGVKIRRCLGSIPDWKKESAHLIRRQLRWKYER